MKQRRGEDGQTQRSEHGALHPPAPSDAFAADPRHALDEGDEADERGHVRHARHHSLCRVAVQASFVLAGVFAWLLTTATASGAQAPGATPLDVTMAVLLGAIQGATEFLPVSSSGHLSLAQVWLGIDPSAAGHRFNITVHAGTLVAVLWIYRSDVGALLRAATHPGVASNERTTLAMMLLASVPLVVVLLPGVEDWVVAMESNPRLVGAALLTTAVILFLAFRGQRGATDAPSTEPPTAKQAILVGCAQLFAVLPGISRSGSTIAAGIALGLDRAAAARFSFLISIIAITGASAKEAIEIATQPLSVPLDPVPYAVGFGTSLVVGLLSLRGLLYLVDRGRVGVFVVYLLLVGGVAVVLG